jgi:hypothetical protein
MQSTSLDVYFNEVEPTLQPREKEVLDIFYENPQMDFTNKELAQELELDTCSITGRVYRLRGLGKSPFKEHPLLIESRKRECRVTKRRSIAWQLNYK